MLDIDVLGITDVEKTLLTALVLVLVLLVLTTARVTVLRSDFFLVWSFEEEMPWLWSLEPGMSRKAETKILPSSSRLLSP